MTKGVITLWGVLRKLVFSSVFPVTSWICKLVSVWKLNKAGFQINITDVFIILYFFLAFTYLTEYARVVLGLSLRHSRLVPLRCDRYKKTFKFPGCYGGVPMTYGWPWHQTSGQAKRDCQQPPTYTIWLHCPPVLIFPPEPHIKSGKTFQHGHNRKRSWERMFHTRHATIRILHHELHTTHLYSACRRAHTLEILRWLQSERGEFLETWKCNSADPLGYWLLQTPPDCQICRETGKMFFQL